MTQRRALLIGYGNPARGDDGLGPAFAELLAEQSLKGLTIQTDYQLSADHAYDMAAYDVVIFADALFTGEAAFQFYEVVDPKPETLGSHAVSPAAALALCTLLFQAEPRTFVLGIRGEQFSAITERLSDRALENLAQAATFFARWYASDLDAENPEPGHCVGRGGSRVSAVRV
jgi:hydrogenase maturation protease